MVEKRNDSDPVETKEWLEALASLIKYEGKERAQFILDALLQEAKRNGVQIGIDKLTTPYVNTIPKDQEPAYPGDLALEATIEALIRWNAIAMVIKAKNEAGGVGGHLSSYASIATMYEVGINHFFHGSTKESLGDLSLFSGSFLRR